MFVLVVIVTLLIWLLLGVVSCFVIDKLGLLENDEETVFIYIILGPVIGIAAILQVFVDKLSKIVINNLKQG